MDKTVETMTLDEIRQELLAMKGWVYNHTYEPGSPPQRPGWQRKVIPAGYCDACGLDPCDCRVANPIPASLDTVASLMPEGWFLEHVGWDIEDESWTAHARKKAMPEELPRQWHRVSANPYGGPDNDQWTAAIATELLARFRLLLLILRKEKPNV